MTTPENTDAELSVLEQALLSVKKKPPLTGACPAFVLPERAMSPREAFFSKKESVPVEESVGRICASTAVACPPAVPVVVSGEVVNKSAAALLRYYGFDKLTVTRESAAPHSVPSEIKDK